MTTGVLPCASAVIRAMQARMPAIVSSSISAQTPIRSTAHSQRTSAVARCMARATGFQRPINIPLTTMCRRVGATQPLPLRRTTDTSMPLSAQKPQDITSSGVTLLTLSFGATGVIRASTATAYSMSTSCSTMS